MRGQLCTFGQGIHHDQKVLNRDTFLHDRRYPPENSVIEQLGRILNLSSDVLYFYARRLPPDIRRDATDTEVEAAYRAFRRVLGQSIEDEHV
jgi:hypothetical protein